MIGGVLIGWGQPASLLFTYAAIPFLCCAGAAYLLGRVPEAHRAAEDSCLLGQRLAARFPEDKSKGSRTASDGGTSGRDLFAGNPVKLVPKDPIG